MKRRILFVDDEPNVLQGLKRMLRPMRAQWDMEFAKSAQDALDHLGRFRFDVIVSDVRMPGMNGVQLLTEVKIRYPQTVRILLSGQSDKELIKQSVDPTHQYLAKPCEAEILKETIARACARGGLVHNEKIKQVLSQIDSMPSMPSLYGELVEELDSPEPSIEKVGAIIAKDLAMTAKILKLVNSAFFGIPRHISDPADAVVFLGLGVIKSLVLGFHIFQVHDQNLLPGFSLYDLWLHSLSTAAGARKIAECEQGKTGLADDAFAGGLLHDVGVLILVTMLPAQYQETLTLATAQGLPLVEAERRTLGSTHAEIGAYLLGIWGLNEPVVEAVACHHDPPHSDTPVFGPSTAVYVANLLDHETLSGQDTQPSPQIDPECLTRLGLKAQIDTWRNLVQRPV